MTKCEKCKQENVIIVDCTETYESLCLKCARELFKGDAVAQAHYDNVEKKYAQNKQNDNFYDQQDTRIAVKRLQSLLECELNVFELNHVDPETIAALDSLCAELASYFPCSVATLEQSTSKMLNHEMKKCTRFLTLAGNLLAVSTEHDMLLALKNFQNELNRYLAAIVENMIAAKRAQKLFTEHSCTFAEFSV